MVRPSVIPIIGVSEVNMRLFLATWIEHHFTDDIQTRQYRCPEVILGAKWGPSADLWSVACIVSGFFFARRMYLSFWSF